MKNLLYLKDEQLKGFIEKIFVSYRETFNDSKKVLKKYNLGTAHHKAMHLISFYDDGEGNAPNPNSGMYDKKCSMCSSQDYILIKDFEYNLEGAQEAVDNSNRLEFEKIKFV